MSSHATAVKSRHRADARAAYNARDFNRAERSLRSLLEAEPNDAWAIELLGRLFLNTDRPADAQQAYEQLLTLDPSAAVMRVAVDTALRLGLHEFIREAIEHWDLSALGDARVCLVIASHPDKRWVASLEDRRISEAELPASWTCLRVRRRAAFGDAKWALEAVEAALADDTLPWPVIPLALRIADYQFRPDIAAAAAARLEKGMDQLPRQALRWLVDTLNDDQRWSVSLGVAERYVERYAADPWGWRVLARCALKFQRSDLVSRAWSQLVEMGRVGLADARVYQRACEMTGDYPALERGIEQLLAAHPRNDQVLLHALNVADQSGNEALRSRLAEMPEANWIWKAASVQRMLKAGRLEDADRCLAEAAAARGSEALLEQWIGVSRDRGDLDAVIRVSDELLKSGPSPWAVRARLEAGMKIWPMERCIDEIEAALQADPGDRQLHRLRIVLSLDAMQDPGRASGHAMLALSQCPDDAHFTTVLGVARSRLGRHRQARNALESARWLAPQSRDVMLAAAQVELAAGRLASGLGWINRMLERSELSPLRTRPGRTSISPDNLIGRRLRESPHADKVSVIMTTYGDDSGLDAAIDSVLAQTHRNLELIVVDDGSEPEVVELLRRRARARSCIKLLELRENQGTYPARNIGLEQATGAYVTFMDSDDFTHPERIERQLDALASSLKAKAVVHDCMRITPEGVIEFRGRGSIRLAPASLLMRAEVFRELGFFDRVVASADTEYVERIRAVFGDASLIHDPLVSLFMRRHADSLTGGGEFAITWRSIAGPRLAYHTAFRRWHRRIRHGQIGGYLEKNPASRPFAAPTSITCDASGNNEHE